ncbi:alcohol oxidase [Lyophyllum atratum]|nr:alcohol oxidase [Lyophyllum atratum]
MSPFQILVSLACSFLAFPLVHTAAIHENAADVQNIKFDFIIVGGGTAGNVVANRLTENPKFKVLVIEAGPSNEGVLTSQVPWFAANNWFSTYDWNYTTTPQVGLGGRPAILPRGFILGGSSSINFLMYTRSTADDYDRIARVTGDKGWSWKSLQPYFKKNEKFVKPADNHDITGQIDPSVHSFDGVNSVSVQNFPTSIDNMVINASRQLGGDFKFVEDYNNGKPLGLGWLQTTVDGPTGRRSSSATSYLAPEFLKRDNLHVLVNAQVSRLIQTRHGKTPSFLTVEFRQISKSPKLIRLTAQREVILSAGALGTPHILLNSGIGDSKALRAVGVKPLVNLPDVGANLCDHSAIANPFVALTNDSYEETRKPEVTARLLEQWKKNGTGPLVNTVASLISFHRVTGDDVPHPDPAAGPDTPHFEHLFANGLIVPNAFVPPDQHIFSVATALVSPASRGTLTINSTNPFDPPMIDPALLKEESDRRMMRAALRHAFKFVSAPIFKGYVLGPAGDLANATTDAELDAYMNAEAGTFFHPTGTAAMSPKSAKRGVLDPDLKVKGIAGLRVVDASVFPDIPSGHTQAAVYVVAERAADIIKSSYGKDH